MWITELRLTKEDIKEARFEAALIRLNRLSREITMSKDDYDFLYRELLKKFEL
jgi:hypothetical protein